MKQIQDWLGHANFNTTADSHLDFSSKVKSADIIQNTLVVGEIAPPLIEAKQNSDLPIVYETENIYEDDDIQIRKSKSFEM